MNKTIEKVHEPVALTILGLPVANIQGTEEALKEVILKTKPQGIAIQVDPSIEMHYQRNIAFHNKNFKIYVEKAIGLPFPIGIHEVCLDLNKINGFNYAKEKGQLKEILEIDPKLTIEQRLNSTQLTKGINEAIETFITSNGIHNYLNSALKLALNKSLLLDLPVYLIQLPELLLRMITATEYKLEQLRGMLEVTLKYYDPSIPLGQLFSRKYPETCYFIRSLYMNSLVRDLVYLHRKSLLVIMEHPYVESLIKEVNEEKPEDLPEYQELLSLPMKLEDETNEELIEKHALLDAAYQTKIWKEKYIDNPLIYLDYNKEAITSENAKEYKRLFTKYYKAYKEMVKRTLNP